MTAHFWMANIVVSGISIIVLTGLLIVYARNFRSIQSVFSIGLVLFAVLFLIHNVLVIAMVTAMMGAGLAYPIAIPVSMLALNLTELFGFGILFWISWQ